MTGMAAERVYVALGSNLGDRAGHLAAARAGMHALRGTTLVAESSVEETPPLGGMDQPAYLNQMVALETTLSPGELLAELQQLERRAGRSRGERWAPRTLDLDIVLFGGRRVAEPGLTIPHPELARRDFWRRELQELGANGR